MLHLIVKNEISGAKGLLAGTGLASLLATFATFAFASNEIVSLSLFILFIICHVWFNVFIFNYNEKRERLFFQLPLPKLVVWGYRYLIPLMMISWFVLFASIGGYLFTPFFEHLPLTSYFSNIAVTFVLLVFLCSHYLFIQTLEEWLFESGYRLMSICVELAYPAIVTVFTVLLMQQIGFGARLNILLGTMWEEGTIILPLLCLLAVQIPLDMFFFNNRVQVHSAWARSPFLKWINKDPFKSGE